MSITREICQWAANHPDKLDVDFAKEGGYRGKTVDCRRAAAHFVLQFTSTAIKQAFEISQSDVDQNQVPGTVAYRVRMLTKILEDDKMPGTAKLEAERTLWEMACYGALSHKQMKLDASEGAAKTGAPGLNSTFRETQFGTAG